jgi:hypothetical protein
VGLDGPEKHWAIGNSGQPNTGLAPGDSFRDDRSFMKLHARLSATVFALTAFLFAAGSAFADSHEAIADDAMAQMERMANAVASITDKATAEKAATELKSVGEELKKVAARAKAVGTPAADVKTKIEEKMKTKQEAIEKKMAAAQESLGKAGPEAMAVLMKSMTELAPVFQEIGEAFEEGGKK